MNIDTIGTLLPKNHVSIKFAPYMLELSKEIFQRYGITGYVHTRMYHDYSRFTLTTDADWFNHAVEKGYYQYTRLDRHPSCYKSGYFLWDAWSKDCPSYQIVVKDAEDNYNGGRGFTILKAEKEWVDKFEFSSETRNYWINQFYLNNIDLLENFVSSYKERAKELIEFAHNNRFKFMFDVDLSHEYSDTMLPSHILAALSSKDQDKKIELYPSFTKRELECLNWLIKGKFVPDIAIILNRSHRTIEKFILTIKEKLDCYTLFQIGQKVSDIGLPKLLDNIDT